MSSVKELIKLWRIWINKGHNVSKEDLDEMEDHLIEEIDYLMKQEHLSEEEAFHKATSDIGNRKEIADALVKIKQERTKRRWRIASSTIVLACFVGLILFFSKGFLLSIGQIEKHIPIGYPFGDESMIDPGFGNRIHPIFNTIDFHIGIDIPAPYGSDLKATAMGIVVEASWDGGYGYMVKIFHSDGIETRYAHCSELLVKTGDKVNRGDIIAKAGNTGTAIDYHVHYEIIQDAKPIDPVEFNHKVLSAQK